jgi:DNA (cytosine-5)-methyltransferase 1
MLSINGHQRSNGRVTTLPLRAIDLFVGAGGLSEGFKQAGFNILAANDFDDDSANTFRESNVGIPFLPGRIQDIRTDDLLKVAGIRKYELDVLSGGPPCQAYSVYNHQRGMHDERSGLFREYLRIVEGIMPKFVVMENVTGMTSVEKGRAVEEIYSSLGALGYHVEHRILKAEEYGVPQQRRRIFFVGSRDGQTIHWPEPTHGDASFPLLSIDRQPLVTVWDAIGDLPELKILEGSEVAEYTHPPFSTYQLEMRLKTKELYNHVAPFLAEINIERMKHIPPGGSWRDVPEYLLPAGMKRARRSDHTKRYGRLHPDGQSSTILTKCDPHWGAFIHPTQERSLTVREAARLQSFPDHIKFMGARGEQCCPSHACSGSSKKHC